MSAHDWRDGIGDFCVADYLAEPNEVHLISYSTPVWALAQTHTSSAKVATQPKGMTETTTTTTESFGTVTEFTPGDSLTLKTEATEPMHYTFSKTVKYVNAHGKVIEASKIKTDSKVRVHFVK